MMTPEEYLAAFQEYYDLCKIPPYPECHEHVQILDQHRPPTSERSGWADTFRGFILDEWYSHRKPELKADDPKPPADFGKWDWM